MLKANELYPHLSEADIQASEKFKANYKRPAPSDGEKAHFKSLSQHCNAMYPVLSNGNRITDIEALETAKGTHRDLMLSNMTPVAPDISSDVVIPRNMSPADMDAYLQSQKDNADSYVTAVSAVNKLPAPDTDPINNPVEPANPE